MCACLLLSVLLAIVATGVHFYITKNISPFFKNSQQLTEEVQNKPKNVDLISHLLQIKGTFHIIVAEMLLMNLNTGNKKNGVRL